eukprot:scaffold6511_cov112-Isochrysis_galbana.AAC.4
MRPRSHGFAQGSHPSLAVGEAKRHPASLFTAISQPPSSQLSPSLPLIHSPTPPLIHSSHGPLGQNPPCSLFSQPVPSLIHSSHGPLGQNPPCSLFSQPVPSLIHSSPSPPQLAADLLGDCLEIALAARALDVAASPYDASAFGLRAIHVRANREYNGGRVCRPHLSYGLLKVHVGRE